MPNGGDREAIGDCVNEREKAKLCKASNAIAGGRCEDIHSYRKWRPHHHKPRNGMGRKRKKRLLGKFLGII